MASVRTRLARLQKLYDFVENDIPQQQTRNADAADAALRALGRFNRRVGSAIRTAGQQGYRAAKAGVRVGVAGTRAAGRAVNRLRIQADHGGVSDRNKRLKGFTMTANEYDQMRIKDRAANMERKKIQDSQNGLGIGTHKFYSKTEQAGGAVAGRNNRAAAAQNAANANAFKLRQRKKAAAIKAIKDSIHFGGIENIQKNLNRFKQFNMAPIFNAITRHTLKVLEEKTPVASGKLQRSAERDFNSGSGVVYYDPSEANYARYVNDGTKHVSAKYMIQKTVRQIKNELMNVTVKTYREEMKL